jgi:hypothetical protein
MEKKKENTRNNLTILHCNLFPHCILHGTMNVSLWTHEKRRFVYVGNKEPTVYVGQYGFATAGEANPIESGAVEEFVESIQLWEGALFELAKGLVCLNPETSPHPCTGSIARWEHEGRYLTALVPSTNPSEQEAMEAAGFTKKRTFLGTQPIPLLECYYGTISNASEGIVYSSLGKRNWCLPELTFDSAARVLCIGSSLGTPVHAPEFAANLADYMTDFQGKAPIGPTLVKKGEDILTVVTAHGIRVYALGFESYEYIRSVGQRPETFVREVILTTLRKKPTGPVILGVVCLDDSPRRVYLNALAMNLARFVDLPVDCVSIVQEYMGLPVPFVVLSDLQMAPSPQE